MTQDQFYFCLSRILVLREQIKETYAFRRKAQIIESAQADELTVDFSLLRRFATDKAGADKNTARAHALIKELAAQEAKIRAFVPVSVYGTRIVATHPDMPTLYVVVEVQSIEIEKDTP